MNNMKKNNLILILIFMLLISCTTNTTNTTNEKNEKESSFTLENINIPKKWIEIPDRNQHKRKDFDELKTIHLTHENNKEVIVYKYGYKSNSFEIKKIGKSKDSLIFTAILQNDTTDLLKISMKYLDDDKFMAEWNVNGVICNYFQYIDTVGNNRVTIE